MDKFRIVGGTPLSGELPTSGSKNSALPALAACLLTDEPVTLSRIPRVKDIATMESLLEYTGAKVTRERRHPGACEKSRPAGSALRCRENHARFEPRAGSASGANRSRPRFHARRLRHRRAAHQPARDRAGTFGRHN